MVGCCKIVRRILEGTLLRGDGIQGGFSLGQGGVGIIKPTVKVVRGEVAQILFTEFSQ